VRERDRQCACVYVCVRVCVHVCVTSHCLGHFVRPPFVMADGTQGVCVCVKERECVCERERARERERECVCVCMCVCVTSCSLDSRPGLPFVLAYGTQCVCESESEIVRETVVAT